MMTLIAILACACTDDQAIRPKPGPVPVIPIPNGPPVHDYWLGTDWTPFTRSRPPWRSARRLEETGNWEEAEVGRQGGRIRTRIADTNEGHTDATTGPRPAGSGHIGAGFECSVFVGSSWTAGLDVEFTSGGPRVVVVLTNYPYDGVNQSYGWSVLAGELVQRSRWYLDTDDLSLSYLLIPPAVRAEFVACLRRYLVSARE